MVDLYVFSVIALCLDITIDCLMIGFVVVVVMLLCDQFGEDIFSK